VSCVIFHLLISAWTKSIFFVALVKLFRGKNQPGKLTPPTPYSLIISDDLRNTVVLKKTSTIYQKKILLYTIFLRRIPASNVLA
jgi:hypothetical protein